MRAFAVAVAIGAITVAASEARAAPTCGSVAAFNASGKIATSGTLTFKVRGIDPNTSGKGALASLIDARSKTAGGQACAGTYFKVYGPGPDLGKVKDELFNVCCTACETCTTDRSGTLGCETWAGEARSSVIFTAPTQTCDIEVRFGGTPNKHSYAISCDDGKGDNGVGDNLYELGVTKVTLLEGDDGVGKIAGATLISEQFCYEAASVAPPADAGPPSSLTLELPVVEDVTAASATPTTVSTDVNDLACGTGEEVFLKFVVPDTVGSVKKATLTLTNAGTPSAEGDGGALYRADSSAWSESTLTWNTRPTRSGAAIASVGAVASGQVVTLDLTSAIATSGTYSFVLVASGSNGTHFASKETGRGPKLSLEYTTAPPPMSEPIDAGTPPATSTDAGATPTHAHDDSDRDNADVTGSCAIGARTDTAWLLFVSAAVAACARRRTLRSRGTPRDRAE